MPQAGRAADPLRYTQISGGASDSSQAGRAADPQRYTQISGGASDLLQAGRAADPQRYTGAAAEVPAAARIDKVIDAAGKLVLPGLINAHTHAYMSIFRNYADDLEFFDWLAKVQAVEERLTVQDSYWAALLSIVEMIRTGTTCFVDMYMHSTLTGAKTGPDGACAAAVRDSGIRAFLSRGMVGEAYDDGSNRRFREWEAEMALFKDEERIRYLLGPHAPYSCAQSLLRRIRDYGLSHQMMATIHLAESEAESRNMAVDHDGRTPAEYVAESGLFDLPVIAAHCVNLTDGDIALLKSKGVSIALNPRSNMKLGNGFAPAEKFLAAGLTVCLGTDGCGSNNTQNLFQEMGYAGLVYKGKEKKARCVDAQEVLRFATEGGAKALQMEGQLGVIREGALADLILLDLQVPQFVPRNDLVSALVYSANGSEVRTVIINGEAVMENGKILTIDEQRVYAECEKITRRLMCYNSYT